MFQLVLTDKLRSHEAEGKGTEMKECIDRPCPIDCVFDEWDDWGACSAECGPGEKQRSRGEKISAQHGGKVCEGADMEIAECQVKPCPVACEVGPWEEEGDCSLTCGSGEQFWKRIINVEAMFGGAPCPGVLEKYLPCNVQP